MSCDKRRNLVFHVFVVIGHDPVLDKSAPVAGHIDPIDFRHRNLLPRGGVVLESLRPLDADISEMMGHAGQAITSLGDRPAAGIAVAATDPGVLPLGGALVRLLADGSVLVMANSADIGQGVRDVLRNVAAKSLNQDPASIRVAGPDTATTPFDWGTGASRSTVIVGLAVEAQGMGYQDVIRVIYGYSFEQDAIVGIRVLESKETPGLGDKIEKIGRAHV